MVAVQIRYWAGAAAAAGVEHETIAADSVEAALTTARAERGAGFASVLDVCSILVGGRRQGAEQLASPLTEPTQVEVLPPFAGG